MCEITRSVKVAQKCLIAVVLVNVDLPYWTSKVEDLVAFAAIVSNICTAHAQKRLYMYFRRKFRHRLSIRQPRFVIRVLNFGDLATVCVDFLHSIFWMSAIFLLPVCLTYWPRKYTTRVDPHVDNSHQVWSRYDHTLPSYSVFVCWYVTWLCDFVTLTFDLLTLNSCCAWRVTWPTLLLSLKTLCLSVLDLWVITFSVGYHWECVRGHCACAESRDPWIGGSKTITYLESLTPICLFTIQLLLGCDDD